MKIKNKTNNKIWKGKIKQMTNCKNKKIRQIIIIIIIIIIMIIIIIIIMNKTNNEIRKSNKYENTKI